MNPVSTIDEHMNDCDYLGMRSFTRPEFIFLTYDGTES